MASYTLSATYNSINVTGINFDTNYRYMQVFWRLSSETQATGSGWISYTTNYVINSIGNNDSPLSPNTTYTVNIAGSNYSDGTNAVFIGAQNITTASAPTSNIYIKINNVWKQAIPYININNTWKQATPYININNTWRF